jgi:catechol 2,3-dioxygenase-like lactoylglutathione lyase family enzyme
MTRTRSSAANLFVNVVVLVCLSSPTQATAQAPVQASPDNPLQLVPDHATLSVADLEKELAWYERVLGFKVAQRAKMDDFEFAHMTIPGYRIDLSQHKGSVRHRVLDSEMEQGWMHIVFKTPAINAVYGQLVAQQAYVKEYKNKDSTINRLIVRDPEGNEIEIQPADRP